MNPVSPHSSPPMYFSAPFLVTFGNPPSSIVTISTIMKAIFLLCCHPKLRLYNTPFTRATEAPALPSPKVQKSRDRVHVLSTYRVVSFQREQQNQVLLNLVSQCLSPGMIPKRLLSIEKCSHELQ